ncbi:amidophosphoribosyltransferase [candidate division CSSED10-310 bacterium]|uniref:Amidophosphoribosyltransferase n=1 Tax=candidate division CSSED10-310 bacterium TaxID=2855610 RepID=A0ABV6YX64_UNCC1
MCGIIGLMENTEVIERLNRGLLTLQHRGQDAAGVLTYDGRFHTKKGLGLIRDVFSTYDDIRNLRGTIGLGHVRYPTIGGCRFEDAQPFDVNYPFGIAIVHNGNVTNYHSLRRDLELTKKRMLYSTNDVEAILNVFAEALAHIPRSRATFSEILNAVESVFDQAKGAYSVILYISGQGLVAFRDPCGIRPLVFGCRTDTFLPQYAIASESAVMTSLGYKNFRDVESGEVIFIDEKSRRVYSGKVQKYKHYPHIPCIFEWVYFARPDSLIDQVNVYKSRVFMGKYLAQEVKKYELDIDVVIPVPDSSRDAAIELARELGLKYREGLVKNRYIGRTFIMPGTEERSSSVKQKLMPIFAEFKDKNVLLVDDSIVRGNTSQCIVQMAREAGASKVYFASYSAPLISPCYYGIDMQTKREFIARGRNIDMIASLIGADKVIYQPIENMLKAVYLGNNELKDFCKACFTGTYPTAEISAELIEEIENDRHQALKACQSS